MPNVFKPINVGKKNPSTTKRNDELDMYLRDIKKYSQLTIEEETKLGENIQSSPKDYNGKPTDRRSVDALVNGNLSFVVSVAKQYENCANCLTILDLISEGNIGLVEAAETFDPTRGFKFISYAVNHIRMRILSAITKKGRIVSDYHKGVTSHHTSLDAPVSDDNDTILSDIICTSTDAESFRNESLSDDIMRVLNGVLKPKELSVICLMFGINTPTKRRDEIADALGYSLEGVRLIEERSIEKLRNNERAMQLLAKYLS